MADLKNNHETVTNYDNIKDMLDEKEAEIDRILDKLAKTNEKMKNRISAMQSFERQKLIKDIRNSGENITEKTVEEAIEKHTKGKALNKIKTPSKKEVVRIAREEIDKQIKDKVKLPGMLGGLGDGIANWLTDSISYSLDKKMLESNNMSKEMFEEKHGKPSWLNIGGWLKGIVGSLALSYFGGDKITELLGKITNSAGSFPTMPIAAVGTGIAAEGSAFKEIVGANDEKVLEAKEKITNKADEVKGGGKDKINEFKEVIDSKNIPYYTGANMLMFLSGIKQRVNRTNQKVYQTFKGMKISEIKDLYLIKNKKNIFLEKHKETITDVNILEDILERLFNNDTSDTAKYLNISMKYSYLESIIKPNGKYNEKLVEEIGKDELENILNSSKNNINNPDWWHSLKFQNISIIHFYSISAIGLLGIGTGENVIKKIGQGVMGLLNEGIDFTNLKESTNEIIPNNVIKEITKNGGLNNGQAINNSKFESKVKSDLKITSDKEKFEGLVKFKNYIIKEFIKDKKINLTTPERELFKNNLSYKYVIGLYGIMGGVEKVKSLSPTNLLSSIYLTSEILSVGGGWNNMESSGYLSRCVWEALDDDSTTFNEDEKIIFGIYKDRFFDSVIKYKMGEYLSILGIGKDDLLKYSAISGAVSLSGFAAQRISNKGAGKISNLKKGKVGVSGLRTGLGRAFGILGWVGLIGAGIMGGAHFYNERIRTKNQDKAFDNMINSGKAEDAIKFFEKLETATSTLNIPGINKKMTIIQWPGDTTMVYFNGKMYTPKVLKTSKGMDEILEEDGNIISDKKGEFLGKKSERVLEKLWDWIKQTGKNILSDESTGKVKIKGKLIELTKTKIDGNKMIIGDNGKEIIIKLDKIAKEISDKSNYKEDSNLISDLNDTIKEHLLDGESESILKSLSDKKKYITIKELDNSNNITKKSLVLLEVGDLSNIGKKAS